MPREIVLTSVPNNDSTAAQVLPVVTGEIELPNGHFAYLEQGHADAPLVLLAHGFPDHPKTFLPLMSLLCAAGYRCVAPWLRGYAPSTLEGPFDRQRVGDDLADLAEALSPNDKAILIGHDWGAAATYTAVGRWPQRFSTAITLGVPHVAAFERNLRRSRSQQQRSAYMAFFMLPALPERLLAYADYAYIDRIWQRWSPNYKPNPDYMRELKHCLNASMPGPLGYFRALRPSRTRLRQSLLDARVRIYVPLLHLHGADDGCIEFAMSEDEERYFEGDFESRLMPGLGHVLHLEDPRQVADAILQFIDEHARRRSEVDDLLMRVK